MRWKLINHLSDLIYSRNTLSPSEQCYLEIGIAAGDTYRNVMIGNKEGVDPMPLPSGIECTAYMMESDSFFEIIGSDKKYDIIFIDGLHLSEQVWRDVYNSLQHVSEFGFIVLDDVCPETFMEQQRDFFKSRESWTGDVWKAFVYLQKYFKETIVVSCSELRGMAVLDTSNVIDFSDIPSELPIEAQELVWPDDYEKYIKSIPFSTFVELNAELASHSRVTDIEFLPQPLVADLDIEPQSCVVDLDADRASQALVADLDIDKAPQPLVSDLDIEPIHQFCIVEFDADQSPQSPVANLSIEPTLQLCVTGFDTSQAPWSHVTDLDIDQTSQSLVIDLDRSII